MQLTKSVSKSTLFEMNYLTNFGLQKKTRTNKILSQNLANWCFISEESLISFCLGVVLKQVFSFDKFYGATHRKIETPAFAFKEVEDFENIRVPLHTHENAHFLFVVKGEYEATVKDKKQSFSTSSMVYYPAGTTHRDHFYTEGERRFMTVSLTSEITQKLSEEINFIDYSIDFNSAEISWLGNRICRELQTPDSLTPIVLDAMANELLVYSARNLDKSDKPPAWLKKAYELINDCCTESITITEIAAAVGVHSMHLARTFRKFFNSSPGEYLRKCRIELATNLLLNSKKPLIDIALTTGFTDQSHFTQCFKQSTGITPAQFRQMHNS
jgi:AraC family transcriptional regulator